jgi:CheY-like chemotaxis protein/signal transduction histidine kinase/CHASE3 domain sensor protein
MKITLDKKILGGFVVCSIVLLIVATISFKNSESVLKSNKLVNHTHEVIYELDQILFSSVNAETGARGFVITKDEKYLEPFNNSKSRLFEHIQKARDLTRDNPILQQDIDAMEKLAAKHINHLERKIEARKVDFEQAKEMVLSGEGKRIQDELRKIAGNAKGLEQELLAQRTRSSEEEVDSFNLVFISMLLIILVVLAVIYFIIMTNLKALRAAETEAANRNWNLSGSSELTRGMQGNKHVKELGQLIINHLGTYFNAQMGAIYVADDHSMELRLAGGYAFDQKRMTSETVQSGEGIVGQAAAEKKVIFISNIPDDYFIINTGFGAVLPKNIIAFPIIFEDRTVSVIELGSVFTFTALQREYLKLVADSIAIALTSSQGREKTKYLLEETQRQSEELVAQQEELKQANEELFSKTKLLEQSESELKNQREELLQINIELEEKANLLEEQKSKLENAKSEIENKVREIEITSKYKSEFLANMSHELRTPLNSILILAQLLSENRHNRLGDKELDYSRNIFSSGTDLLNLINEILDLSKVEAGKLELDISEVPVLSLADSVSTMFSEVARNKSVALGVNVDPEFQNLLMVTDVQRVQQILRNLLSNAFKFTAEGGHVTLTVGHPMAHIDLNHQHLKQANKVIAFAVSDTGIGIPQDKQRIIFEAFQQADGSTKRKYGGTGLGLSISREFAKALGGEIQLESTEGKGSTFILFLPQHFDKSFVVADRPIGIKEQKKQKPKEHVKPYSPDHYQAEDVIDDRNDIGTNDRVVLIIEDEKQFAYILLNFVRERGYKGVIALQGNTGVSYARHYKPDAILLDLKLPVMDGIEVLGQIKNDPALRHIPVQIISSYDSKKQGLELGALDFIRKPVNTADLQKVFDRIEKFRSAKLKKLLIVEDNVQQNNAIKELIGNGDVKSFSAYSGAEADKMLNAEGFDCIIVDLGLPDMSGFDLLERIKENEKLKKIPVIVYTGKDLKKEDTARLNKLADTVVLKTVNSQERLLDETMLFLHRVESKLPKEKQTIIRQLHHTDEILKGKKILLADDDSRNIYSLTNALEDEGVQCLVAENGKVALGLLEKNPDIEMILMDIMMPEMDGYEATIAIRKLENFKKLPIIALTAKAMKGDKEKCLAVGMSDYISKPVDIGQLLSLMRVWLYR